MTHQRSWLTAEQITKSVRWKPDRFLVWEKSPTTSADDPHPDAELYVKMEAANPESRMLSQVRYPTQKAREAPPTPKLTSTMVDGANSSKAVELVVCAATVMYL